MQYKNKNKNINLPVLLFITGIGSAVIAATILLPGLFFEESALPINFYNGIGYVCFIEACIIIYAALPCFSGITNRIAMTAYAGIAIPLFIYLIAGVVTIFTLLDSKSLFYTATVIQTIVFAFIAGAMVLIGRGRMGEVTAEKNERHSSYKPALAIRSIRDSFTTNKSLSPAAMTSASDLLRKLEERAASSTRFGRPGAESVEYQIITAIEALEQKVESLIKSSDTKTAEEISESIKSDAQSLIKKFDLRERSLVS